jgi:hypothetical protein
VKTIQEINKTTRLFLSLFKSSPYELSSPLVSVNQHDHYQVIKDEETQKPLAGCKKTVSKSTVTLRPLRLFGF